ncbi:protein cholesin isoform 2-T2 [Pluvialis apricaria]
MDHIRNSLLALSQITVSSGVRCWSCSLTPRGPSWTWATAPSYLVNQQIQHKNGNKRRGRTYRGGKEETGKKTKERAQEERKTADEGSWNLYEKGRAQKAVGIRAGSGLFNQVPDKYFTILLDYLQGLQGGARDITVQKAEAFMKELDGSDAEDPNLLEKCERIRQVLQLLS